MGMPRSNHIKIGPVIIRVGSKHLAPWGFPRIKIGGLSLWSWTNTGQLVPASYPPRKSITWLWSLWVEPRRPWRWTLHRQSRMPRRQEREGSQ